MYSVGMANDTWGIFGLQGHSENVCTCVLPEIQEKEFTFFEQKVTQLNQLV